MSYRIAKGEQGVLTFEPYKSILLPYWRFKTVPIAENSSKNLKVAFDHYVKAGDLVGSDMVSTLKGMMSRAIRIRVVGVPIILLFTQYLTSNSHSASRRW